MYSGEVLVQVPEWSPPSAGKVETEADRRDYFVKSCRVVEKVVSPIITSNSGRFIMHSW
jgi:hypothetical protein